MAREMKELLGRLYDHLSWANRAVIESFRSGRPPSARQLELLSHLLAAEELWLGRIEGLPPLPRPWPRLSLDACASLAEWNVARFVRILESADEQEMKRMVSYTNTRGESFTNTLENIMMHVAMHGTYHRGQIAAARRAEGAEPVDTDYIHYIRSIRKAES